MNQLSSIESSQNLSSTLYKTLLERIPPKKHSAHLEDLVKALVGALSRGLLEVNLNTNKPPNEIKEKGIEATAKSYETICNYIQSELKW